MWRSVFCLRACLRLMVAPAFWKRAVRLTKRRVEMTMPMSAADIQADKDQLRAEFAIELRRVEVALEKAKDKAARELVEANKRRVEISEIKTELEGIKGRLQEKDNANRVLEQTIRRRLPELEGRLKAAKEAMAELEAANAELRNTAGAQAEALKLARSTLNTQRGDIDQLRGALEGEAASSRRSAKSDATLAKENRQAQRRAVQAQAGAQPTDESAATRMVSCAMSSASSQARSSPWPRHKARGCLTSHRPRPPPPAREQAARAARLRARAAFVGSNGGDAREALPPTASMSPVRSFRKVEDAAPRGGRSRARRRQDRSPSSSPPARRDAAARKGAGPAA